MSGNTISTYPTKAKLTAVLLAAVFAFLLTFFYGTFGAAVAGVLFLVWFFSSRLIWGWYILVFLSPFVGWQIYLNQYINHSPVFSDWNAPPVEFWAILMLLAFGVNYIRQLFIGQKPRLLFPMLKYFLPFILSAVVSLVNVPVSERHAGIKFIAHFLVLTYFGYVFLAGNIVRTRREWENSLKILVGVGIFSALMGVWSLVVGFWEFGGFYRAVPLMVGKVWPLGDQHILLAEFLIIALVCACYFYFKKPSILNASMSIFIGTIGLFTLARSFWLAFFITAVVLLWEYRAEINFKYILNKAWPLVILLFFIAAYWFNFMISAEAVIGSSNQARTVGAAFSWELFTEYPILGAGVGSYIPRLSFIKYYWMDFGDAVDALGWPQKILSEQGLFGVATFAWLIGGIFYAMYRAFKKEKKQSDKIIFLAAFCLLLAPIIFEMFTTNYYSARLWVPFALAMIVLLDYEN